MSALLPLPPLVLVKLFVPESLTFLVSKQRKYNFKYRYSIDS